MSANDPNAICGAINQARQGGAKVVTFDSDTNKDCRDLFVNQATAQGIAENQVKLISEQIGGAGKIAILSATPNATNQNAWIELMKKELKKPEYAKIELVTVAYGNDEDQKSFQETQGLLSSYPDLKGIISPTTVGIAAAARYLSGFAVQGQGRADRPGHAEPDAGLRQGRHGQVRSPCGARPTWATWPRTPGRRSTSGLITGKEGEKFTAGKLGEYTVGGRRCGGARPADRLRRRQHRPVRLLS